MPFAEMRPTTGYCEHFEKGIKNANQFTNIFNAIRRNATYHRVLLSISKRVLKMQTNL